MKNKYQKNNSNKLNLHFEFEITYYLYRELKIVIKSTLKKIKFDEKYFETFIKELVYFLSKNEYNKRWDYEKIFLYELKNLNLNSEELKKFKKEMTYISNFDLLEGK